MFRRILYTLGALSLLVVLILFLGTPRSTREVFIGEFVHRCNELFGVNEQPRTVGGERGLRSEHPEEYGGGEAAAEPDSEDVPTPANVTPKRRRIQNSDLFDLQDGNDDDQLSGRELGRLNNSEELAKWDKNQDEQLNREEYTEFLAHVEAELAKDGQPDHSPATPADE